MFRTPTRRARHAALLGASALALVFAVAPERAQSQDFDRGFQGTHVVNAGSATVTTATNSTTVNVNSSQAVVTWTPTSNATTGTIDFLPEETSATFTSALGEYTILNRIVPGGTAKIGLNGSISSLVSDANGLQSTGGNVWFYTPNGFIIGGNAVMTVGGLLLTTNDVGFTTNPNGGVSFLNPNGAIEMRGPAGSTGSIVNNGTIDAASYVAMVAPRVEQHGLVTANTSIAYVAGEEVDLTIDGGLFGITVLTGTTDANGIVHTNTTTGSSAGFFDSKTISFVAIPKNDAMTMLLSGNIGYAPASEVFFEGSSIVLTAGDANSPEGNIRIGTGTYANRLTASATGMIEVAGTEPANAEGQEVRFQRETALYGNRGVTVTADAGVLIAADRSLSLSSQRSDGNGGEVIVRALGGTASLQAGAIEIASYLDASASGYGGSTDDEATGFEATGGTVTLAADGGRISAQSIYAYATGSGGSGYENGGDGRGGTVNLTAGYGGTIETGYVSLDASGFGGYLYSDGENTGGAAGDGHGGTVNLADSGSALGTDTAGGSLQLGYVQLDASADGGYTGNSEGGVASGRAGDAFGGTVNATIDRQSHFWSDVYATVNAHEGNTAVDPIGGTINFTIGGGVRLDIAGALRLNASAVAGVDGGEGAFARGGTINLTVEEASTLAVGYQSTLYAEASAQSGYYYYNITPDSTPDLTGGTVNVTVDGNSLFQSGDIYVGVGAYNQAAESYAGFAQAGTINLTASNGGAIETVASEGYGGIFQLSADAYGGNGTIANVVTGGTVNISALFGGRISSGAGTIQLFANAEAFEPFEPCIECEGSGNGEFALLAVGDDGADATGGTIAIDAIGGAIASPLVAEAIGRGGDVSGAGGDGTGGTIAVRVLEGGELTGALAANAYGEGGESSGGGDGGDGRGGSLTLTSDALAKFTAFSLDYQGYGEGGEAAAGVGGDGYGGTAQVDIIGGEVNWSSAYLNVWAEGAASRGGGSLAGSANGDEAGSRFHVGGGASLSIGDVFIDASAYADANGEGNEAIGGTAGVLVDGGASLFARDIGVGANGYLLDFSFDPNTTQSTPTVRGGTASLIADGGFIDATLIEVVADADTAGALTSAGTATGGTAIAGAANGGSIALDFDFSCEGLCFGGLQVHADGHGGEGPSAAHAFGGTATVYTQGGTITSPYELSVTADALAGSYAGYFDEFDIPSSGMDATGGTASVEMRGGGTGTGAITVPSLTVSAQGRANDLGSVIGNGGKGVGGTATLLVAEGNLDSRFGIDILANGYGGSADANEEGAEAFTGGDGEGGSATFELAGGTVGTARVGIQAIGQGANGEGLEGGATSSLAGNGAGGDAAFRAIAGSLITLGFGEGGGDFTIDGSGYGGEGAFNPDGGVGGNGGNGAGGSALFEAPPGSTADLTIGVRIAVLADGVGGGAGFSVDEIPGTGGNGRGGSAAMRLADIPFAFGEVFVSGSGYAGFGDPEGVGDGGNAEFSLVDSGTAAAGRSLGLLTLQATGLDSDGIAVSGAAGTLIFNALAGNPEAGLAIDGNLLFDGRGATAAAGNGFTGSVAGAPVTVGGTAELFTPRDAALTIAAPGALAVTGDLTIDVGRSFTSTGALSTLANASVTAPGGIAMTDLSSGGTTLLQAVNGPVSVSNNLLSGGLVTVLGRSVNIASLGALSFADVDATAGGVSIRTVGDLDLVTVDASGAVTLASADGDVHNTGPVNGTDLTFIAGGDVVSDTAISATGNLTVDAGGMFVTPDASASATGNVSLSADLGLDLASVVSGGTTLLQADGGAINVASLTSPGAVTASGRSIAIASPGALTFTSATATAGNLQLSTAGGLSLGQGSATGSTSLISSGGAVGVTNLLSGGPVTARGTVVTIGSTGALSFADLDATAGNVSVQTAGNLAVNTVDATGSITLVSTGGSLAASGALNGVGITLGSFTDLTLTSALATSGAISLTSANGAVSASSPLTAGGNLTVSGLTGVTLGSASSGGTTVLTATSGPILVTNLASAGAVTARGGSVTIGSTGGLAFADLDATAGIIAVTTAGNLAVSTVDATGSVSLTSTGGSLTAGGAINGNGIALSSAANLALTQALSTPGALSLTSTGGAVTAASSIAGGSLAVSGQSGVTLGAATSGGTTSLTAANGAVSVTNLASTGAVSASGRAVTIGSTGTLNVASAQATAGNLAVSTGQGLSVGTASASGTVTLNAAADLVTTGAVSGAGVTLTGANVTTGGAVQSSGALALTAQQLLTINALASGTAIIATSSDIAIGASGRLGSRGQTQSLTLTNHSASAPINFGGAAVSGQYSIDQAEAARLFADQSITVAARSSEGGGGDIRIGTLAMSYGAATSANIGSGGTLKVDTAGNVIVDGAVALTTSSAGDTFSIDPQRIEVIAGSGSIAMLGSGGTPQGTLILEAGTIVVGEQAAIEAIGSSSDLTAIRAVLDQPTATQSDSGSLVAGSIEFLAGDALYIQNTGLSTANSARRGFTAGAVNIETGSAETRIAINGVLLSPTGTLTGRQAIDGITINGGQATTGGQFDPLSTINGCVIGSACTTGGGPPASVDLDSPVVNDLGGPGLSGELIQLGENEPLITPPLVDEPITGVGNDDLWQVHCDPEEDKGDCPTDTAGEGEETPE